jgi:hypothetical protein
MNINFNTNAFHIPPSFHSFVKLNVCKNAKRKCKSFLSNTSIFSSNWKHFKTNSGTNKNKESDFWTNKFVSMFFQHPFLKFSVLHFSLSKNCCSYYSQVSIHWRHQHDCILITSNWTKLFFVLFVERKQKNPVKWRNEIVKWHKVTCVTTSSSKIRFFAMSNRQNTKEKHENECLVWLNTQRICGFELFIVWFDCVEKEKYKKTIFDECHQSFSYSSSRCCCVCLCCFIEVEHKHNWKNCQHW